MFGTALGSLALSKVVSKTASASLQSRGWSLLTHRSAKVFQSFRCRFSSCLNHDGDIFCDERSAEDVRVAIDNWLTDIVRKRKLCPWAGPAIESQGLRVVVLETDIPGEIFETINGEAEKLIKEDSVTTTLIATPNVFRTFKYYYAAVSSIEHHFEDTKMNEHVQLATFHPKYIFPTEEERATKIESMTLEEIVRPGDVHYDPAMFGVSEGESYRRLVVVDKDLDLDAFSTKPSDYTNRSPVPLFHLLKVEQVFEALHNYPGDPDDIWRRNQEIFAGIGISQAQKDLDNCWKDVDQ